MVKLILIKEPTRATPEPNEIMTSNKSILPLNNSRLNFESDDEELKKFYVQRPKYHFHKSDKNQVDFSTIPLQDDQNNNKSSRKKELERSIQEIENRNQEINKNLENLRMDRSRLEDKSFTYNNNQVNVSYNNDHDRLKYDNNTLKSDNIMFKEEVNMLNELNRRLDADLSKQRNRK